MSSLSSSSAVVAVQPPRGAEAGSMMTAEWIDSALESGLEGSAMVGSLQVMSSRSLEMGEIKAALSESSEAVTREMLELMSSRYSKFFEVADSVSAAHWTETREKLLALHDRLGAAAREAAARSNELQGELDKRRSERKKRQEAEAIDRFEALLNELEDDNNNNSTSGAPPDVERAAHAALSLRAQLSSAVELVSSDGSRVTRVHGLASRVHEAASGAERLVEAAFDRLCCSKKAVAPPGMKKQQQQDDSSPSSCSSIAACLRAAGALGLGPRLEKRYAETVFKAFLEATMTPARLDGNEKGSRNGLASIYAATLDFVAERSLPTLKACEEAAGEEEEDAAQLLAVDLTCNGVWLAVAGALSSKLPQVFELGIAAVAHKSFQLTLRFVEDLARLVGGGGSQGFGRVERISRRLMAHPATKSLFAKWDLRVYFELVKVDLVSSLDEALFEEQAPPQEQPATGEVRPSRWVVETVRAVDKLWEGEPTRGGFFVKPLAGECAGLTFELVSKALRAAAQRLDDDGGVMTDNTKRRNGSGDHRDNNTSEEAAGWRRVAWRMAQLASDVDSLERALSGSTPSKVADALRGRDAALAEDAPVDAVVRAMDLSVLRPVRPIRAKALERLAEALADATIAGLRAVKGVPARYTLTGMTLAHNAPPSEYLDHDALDWLLDTFDDAWRDLLPAPPHLRPRLATAIAERFAPMVATVLQQATNFQLSLRKRAEGAPPRQPPAGPTTGGLTDLQKIASQLLIDLDHLQARLDDLATRRGHTPFSDKGAAAAAPLFFDTASLDKTRIALRDAIDARL